MGEDIIIPIDTNNQPNIEADNKPEIKEKPFDIGLETTKIIVAILYFGVSITTFAVTISLRNNFICNENNNMPYIDIYIYNIVAESVTWVFVAGLLCGGFVLYYYYKHDYNTYVCIHYTGTVFVLLMWLFRAAWLIVGCVYLQTTVCNGDSYKIVYGLTIASISTKAIDLFIVRPFGRPPLDDKN